MEENAPIAWLALEAGTAIHTSDGEQIGKVDEVIADRQKDIFSGITFKPGMMGGARFIPADKIEEMSATSVQLSLTKAEADELEPYES